MEGHEWRNMGIIAISVVVVASVLFGIVFCIPLWYAYALRCAIFAVLGYWFAKKEPFKEILPKSNKILSFALLIVGFTLAFLFVFGLIFVVCDLAGTTLSSVIPFAFALVLTANWDNITTSFKKTIPVRYEGNSISEESKRKTEDAPVKTSKYSFEEDSENVFQETYVDDLTGDSSKKTENYIDDAS